MKLTPRPYQIHAVDAVKNAYFSEGVNNVLVQKPTGTGKTVFFSMLPDAMEIGSRRMMVLVHREELADQAADKLKAWNPTRSVGIEMGTRSAGDAQIVVASPQTIGRAGNKRIEQFRPEDFALLVTDECHHATATSYVNVFNYFGTRERGDILNIGVTATTKRSDGSGLNAIYDKIVYQMSMLDAIKQGWLSDLRCHKVGTGVNIDHVSVTKGDFTVGEMAQAINTPARNNLIVAAYQRLGEGRKFIAFAEDVKHAQDLAATFGRNGHKVEAVWGDDPKRAEKLARHRAGELDGLINCQLLTEGYDDWAVACIIMARPTKSELLYTQMVGRGTRIPAGINNLIEAQQAGQWLAKRDCMVLDIVDVSTRHSLCTLPSLLGLNDKADMKGKTVSAVMKDVEEIQHTHTGVDVAKAEDLSQLQLYAEQVDLFHNPTPPEILQFSEYRWKRSGDDYYISLFNGEWVFLISDMLGRWKMRGNCNSYELSGEFPTLEEAVKEADYQIRARGGRMYDRGVRLGLATDNDAPTPAQLGVIRKFGVPIPPGVNKGQARDLISRLLRQAEWRRMNRLPYMKA